MKRVILITIMILWATSAHAANWYVDNTATGSNNGTSWANAWKNFSNITGVKPGDTVYISGGTNGQTYNVGTSDFLSASGTSGNPITYKVSTESGKNGMVTIVGPGAGYSFIWANSSQGYGQWITVDGNVNGVSHLTVTDFEQIVYGDASVGITLRYIITPNQFRCWGCDQTELDHINFVGSNGIDGIIRGIGDANTGAKSGYTRNSIHDCLLEIAYQSGNRGLGDDGMQGVGNISIYNNIIMGKPVSNYLGNQHQDGIQAQNSYVSIYNNYFKDVGQYPIYGDWFSRSSDAHWRIYNNVFYNCPTVCFTMGCDGRTCSVDDILVANNTCVNSGNIGIGDGGTPGTWTNLYIVNNLNYNGGGIYHGSGSPQTISNNYVGTANIQFVSSTNFHLQSNSTAIINKGISPSYLTSVYTTDKDGVQRSGWDIGAYEFVTDSASNPMPPVLNIVN